MDQFSKSSRTSVLETLLKTNRLPTDQEKETILESMDYTHSKLKVVEGKISEVMAHIEAWKDKLHCLRTEEAAILEEFEDHRRVFAPFRNVPEDVLREICVACVQGTTPTLPQYGLTPVPYILGQICGAMRRVAWSTPTIWASMCVNITGHSEQSYAVLARRATEWLERAGGLPLTLTFLVDGHSDNRTLFDAILRYSNRWKEIRFNVNTWSPPTYFAALTAAELPMLESISFDFTRSVSTSLLRNSELFRVPTLRHVALENSSPIVAAHWAILTSLTLNCKTTTENEVGRILQQTKRLQKCVIFVHRSDEHYVHRIDLPFLKTLIVGEETRNMRGSAHSILGRINAPNLAIFQTRIPYFDLSLLGFFQRSPRIRKLFLFYFEADRFLMETIGLLNHCPSLAILSLDAFTPHEVIPTGDPLLRAFVVVGNGGIICPRLQELTFLGQIRFSLDTLRMLLDGKQGNNATLNILPWRKVTITTTGIKSEGQRRQISALISQKKAEGLDVRISS